MIFKDRCEAGQQLAAKLVEYKNKNPVLFALPRGGVPIAYEISRALGVPWDLLLVRKIGAPFDAELAVGAVCESEKPVWNQFLLARLGILPENLKQIILTEQEKIKTYRQVFRQGHEPKSVLNKTVIIVDDGLATGATAIAAVNYARKKGAKSIVFAVPVAAASSARFLRTRCDAVITVEESEELRSVGNRYENFSEVSQEDVISLLNI